MAHRAGQLRNRYSMRLYFPILRRSRYVQEARRPGAGALRQGNEAQPDFVPLRLRVNGFSIESPDDQPIPLTLLQRASIMLAACPIVPNRA